MERKINYFIFIYFIYFIFTKLGFIRSAYCNTYLLSVIQGFSSTKNMLNSWKAGFLTGTYHLGCLLSVTQRFSPTRKLLNFWQGGFLAATYLTVLPVVRNPGVLTH